MRQCIVYCAMLTWIYTYTPWEHQVVFTEAGATKKCRGHKTNLYMKKCKTNTHMWECVDLWCVAITWWWEAVTTHRTTPAHCHTGKHSALRTILVPLPTFQLEVMHRGNSSSHFLNDKWRCLLSFCEGKGGESKELSNSSFKLHICSLASEVDGLSFTEHRSLCSAELRHELFLYSGVGT